MNELINSLAEQADLYARYDYQYPDDLSEHYYMIFEKKFAELIVKECVQVAGDNACSPEETPDPIIGRAKLEVVKAIIRHFQS